jgi:hypothetical protein
MTDFNSSHRSQQKGPFVNITARIAATFNRSGAARDDVVGAAAMPAVSGGSKGSGARSSRHAPVALIAALATVTAFALTAAPASADPPSTTCCTISNVSYASVHLTGKLNSDGSGLFEAVTYTFQYSTDESNWSTGFSEQINGTFSNKPIEANITLPEDGTKYYVRLIANNFGENNPEGTPPGGATSPGPNPTFTTLVADPPSVERIDNASEVAYTTAKATGEINRPVKSDNVACHFEYITDTAYQANEPSERFAGATSLGCEPEESVTATGHVAVSAKLTGLANATTYHLRLAVSGAGGKDAKEALSPFTTLTVGPPSVKSVDNASEVEYTQAQVKGVVERPATSPDPALDVNCNFEYITDAQFKENEEVNLQPGFTGATPVACEGENPITAANPTAPTPVEAELTGLAASTTYHLRLSASNQGGAVTKDAVATFTTEGPIPTPVVLSVADATEVAANSAKFAGSVERPAGADPALDVSCRFEFVTQKQFTDAGFEGAGQAPCAEPITSPGAGHPAVTAPVSAEFGSLRAGTTYHLRLAAENGGGTDSKEAADTFTTEPAELPTVTIDPVGGSTYTTAHVTGTVTLTDGHTAGSTPYLQVSSDGGATWSSYVMHWTHNGGPESGGEAHMVDGEGLYIVNGEVTGLQPSTTYLFRTAASYNGNFSTALPNGITDVEARGEVGFSPEETITTEPLFAPTAEDLAVTAVTGTSAHFSATVDPHAPAGALSAAGKKAFATHWEFVCTPECKNSNGNAIEGTVQGEEGAQVVAGDAKRLEPNKEYEVSLVIHSEGGDETVVITFHTEAIAPTVKSSPGASDGQGGYTLQGVVNPNNNPITGCEFKWGPNSAELVFGADCSPVPGEGSKPVTVEAHLSGLTPGAAYHSLLVVEYGAGAKADGGPQTFEPTLNPKEPCPNEALRKENSSLALPECRAYEMVTPPNKQGFSAELKEFTEDGSAVAYSSQAGNIANSGSGEVQNGYVADRTGRGWETVPDLNGPLGSPFAGPQGFGSIKENYVPSADLRSSLWFANPKGLVNGAWRPYIRNSDGSFTLVGSTAAEVIITPELLFVGTSDDLSHVVFNGWSPPQPPIWGGGVYEFVGTGSALPRRVDLDNSGEPISACNLGPHEGAATGMAVSTDGRTIIFAVGGGCGAPYPPANEIWARVGGTTSYNLSASQCNRIAPADPCNAPASATFQGASKDGSRVYFTTTQQLVNGDTDETTDLYACDIPSGPQAPTGTANPCSALHQVSGPAPGAQVENVVRVSDDGSTVYFTAQGVLADNEDALKEQAVAGDHNLYVWRTDAAHPSGQTTFVARLESNDIGGLTAVAQTTADGRYLVFNTANQLVPTDTDNSRDVYRYDADTGAMTRVSTNVYGVGGNADNSDAGIRSSTLTFAIHHSHPAISDDGEAIVFTTSEALSPLDGNGQPDVYLWKAGHVSLISTGAVGGGTFNPTLGGALFPTTIDGSGTNIYFGTSQELTPGDGDDAADVYDARIDGGFPGSPPPPCSGETCQPPVSAPPPAKPRASERPGSGNPTQPKPCPKGKVRKHGKCVKKSSKKHHHSKSHKNKRTASHGRGGNK